VISRYIHREAELPSFAPPLIGDKQRMLEIAKRGDPYLRMLLIHGARSMV